MQQKQMLIDVGKVGPLLSFPHPSLAPEHQAGETVGMAGTPRKGKRSFFHFSSSAITQFINIFQSWQCWHCL